MTARGSTQAPEAVAERHRRFLGACLDLARMGEGETSPNPMVGAILVKDERILGQGFHRRAGDPHAEMEALDSAGQEARGATLYVNLEPCVHHGRTPPCVDALIEAGVREVVACMIDPDPRVNGRGFRRLQEAGVVIQHGILREVALELNEKFIKFVVTGMPFVTLKAGMTLDGKIAPARGGARWITSETAREEAHRMRFAHDAVLVGVGTILADDPLLTARWGKGKAQVRVILDSRLRTPPLARALHNADGGHTLIYTLRDAPAAARSALEKNPGVEVAPLPGDGEQVDFGSALEDLGRRRIQSILVEGGGKILGSALRSGKADRLALFIAPKIIGDSGVGVFRGLPSGSLAESIQIREFTSRALGSDILVEGRLSESAGQWISRCSPE